MSAARVTWKKKTSGSFTMRQKESAIANICNSKNGFAHIDKWCKWRIIIS